MRVVLDTNILIGALITKGTSPDSLYQAWLRDEFELVTSLAQLSETAQVLARPRLRRFVDGDEAAGIVDNMSSRAVVLRELPVVDLSSDPDDNPILYRNRREGRPARHGGQETLARARSGGRHSGRNCS